MSDYYIQNEDGTVRAVPFEEWLEQERDMNRQIAYDEFPGVRVSTVFLGLDHSFGRGAPVLWETMIFGGEHDQCQERYISRDAALEGHARAVALVTAGLEAKP